MIFEGSLVLTSYKIRLSSRAREDLYQIRDYIANQLKAPQTANKVIDKLTSSFSRLALFPQAGFDADQKIGRRLNPSFKTYGYVYKRYIIFYTIHETAGDVLISHILDSRSEYLSLFLKE